MRVLFLVEEHNTERDLSRIVQLIILKRHNRGPLRGLREHDDHLILGNKGYLEITFWNRGIVELFSEQGKIKFSSSALKIILILIYRNRGEHSGIVFGNKGTCR